MSGDFRNVLRKLVVILSSVDAVLHWLLSRRNSLANFKLSCPFSEGLGRLGLLCGLICRDDQKAINFTNCQDDTGDVYEFCL